MKKPLLIAILFLLSCHHTREFKQIVKSEVQNDFSDTKVLKSDVVYDKIEFFNPETILIKDSLFFVLDQGRENKISCYNLNTQELISSFLTKGKSASEMIRVRSIHFHGDDSIQVSSASKFKNIYIYAISDILSGNLSNHRYLELPGDSLIVSEKIVVNKTLFAIGYNIAVKNRFLIGDDCSVRNTEQYEDRYFENSEELLINEKELAYSPIGTAINQSLNKVAIALTWFPGIEVVDVKTGEIVESRYYDRPKVQVKEKPGVFRMATYCDDKKCGFLSVTSSDDRIYSTYSNKFPTEKNCYKAGDIYAYNWKLKPIRHYHTDDLLLTIFVTKDDKYLYGLRYNPESDKTYELVRYEL